MLNNFSELYHCGDISITICMGLKIYMSENLRSLLAFLDPYMVFRPLRSSLDFITLLIITYLIRIFYIKFYTKTICVQIIFRSCSQKSYTSQVVNTLEKRCSPKPFGQTKNGLVSGRLACTSSKTEVLNKIGM